MLKPKAANSTACAAEAIAYASKNYPEMSIGAGTVINAKQCKAALKAGATFIVSPGFSPAVTKVCKKNNIPYYPGCVTPTEIMAALELGTATGNVRRIDDLVWWKE